MEPTPSHVFPKYSYLIKCKHMRQLFINTLINYILLATIIINIRVTYSRITPFSNAIVLSDKTENVYTREHLPIQEKEKKKRNNNKIKERWIFLKCICMVKILIFLIIKLLNKLFFSYIINVL